MNRQDLYIDSYQVITDIGNGQALWSTRYLDCQTMPILWAKKVIRYFEAGNEKAAYKLIDMVNDYIEKMRRTQS